MTQPAATAGLRQPQRQQIGIKGFTLIEMLLVVVVIGILVGVALPRVSRLTKTSKVSRAAEVVQQDLQRAFAIAARLRKPVQFVADNSNRIYQVRDLVGSTVRLTRRLDPSQDIGVESMTFFPTTVTIQPTGVASDTIGVTLVSDGSTRRVSATRVGLVRRTQ